MARDNFYFYTSGFISLFFFTTVLVLFFSMIFSSNKIDSYALQKENYISVSIEIPKVQTKKTKKVVTPPSPVVEASVESQDINVDDLFSQVWTKKINKPVVKEKKIDAKRLQEIQKRIKTVSKNKTSKIAEKIVTTEVTKNDDETKKVSTATEVNEYLAKIQATVYEYFYPPQNSQGHSVKAVIELSAIGKVLDFRILNYSSNVLLNQESDRIKQRLKNVVFPINPDNKSAKYIIILTSKE